MKKIQKYCAFLRISANQTLQQFSGLVGKVLFYLLITFIMSRVWKATGFSAQKLGMSVADLIWYVTITEWILISTPMMHFEIEKEVQKGEIAYALCRPISYVWMQILRGMGAFVVQATVLGLSGGLFAYYLTGQFLSRPQCLWWGIPLGIFAGFLWTLFQVLIGISTFWLMDASPFYWVWQKSAFVLGGLILPLSIYPTWFRHFAEYTPCAAILYGPAQAIIGGNARFALSVAGSLLFWSFLTLLITQQLFHMGIKRLDVSGG